MKISRIYSAAVIMVAALALTSCNNKKFHINGNITEAQDSMLYLENLSLNGPVKIDSVKLGEDGSFAFEENAMDSITPEFYRLRIANQSINLSIDSTETVNVKAAYPQMSYKYEVEGSENCSKIKELSLKRGGFHGCHRSSHAGCIQAGCKDQLHLQGADEGFLLLCTLPDYPVGQHQLTHLQPSQQQG